jgi:hypothetical protein
LGECDSPTHLGGDPFDALDDGAVLIDEEYIAPLIHDFDDEFDGDQFGDWLVGVAWFERFGYTKRYDAFQVGLLYGDYATPFDIFAQKEQQRRGLINPAGDALAVQGEAGEFRVSRQQQPAALALVVELERKAQG